MHSMYALLLAILVLNGSVARVQIDPKLLAVDAEDDHDGEEDYYEATTDDIEEYIDFNETLTTALASVISRAAADTTAFLLNQSRTNGILKKPANTQTRADNNPG